MIVGVFNNRSYNGFKGSFIKSGICKYTRRSVFDKLEYCIVEMTIFGIKSKPLFTNLLNRLKILYEVRTTNSFRESKVHSLLSYNEN